VLPQAQPGQVPPQAQPGQVNPGQKPVQLPQRQNNINLLPQHVAQPIQQLRDPVDANELMQSKDNVANNPPQVESVK
jgi:hypothetical protein